MSVGPEPWIDINGVELTDAQAMTVRVAVNSFAAVLQDPDALGDDEHGRRMTELYRARLGEISKLLTRDR